MSQATIVRNEIAKYRENELFWATVLYKNTLSQIISEAAYYKTLERMCKKNQLIKIAKGTYYRPLSSKYGTVPPSDDEIKKIFINNEEGVEIGYAVYNNLNLTTQISKKTHLLSSSIDNNAMTIRNITIQQMNIRFTESVCNMIQCLDVLQNYSNIEDINNYSFLQYTKKIAEMYNEQAVEEIIVTRRFKKSTIAFLREILDFYNVKNTLYKHLSPLSQYKHPKIEAIYETTQIS